MLASGCWSGWAAWLRTRASPPVVLVTHHCEEIPPGFTHGGLVSRGRLLAAGPLGDVITSAQVSACFEVSVDVGCTDGRWWSRAA